MFFVVGSSLSVLRDRFFVVGSSCNSSRLIISGLQSLGRLTGKKVAVDVRGKKKGEPGGLLSMTGKQVFQKVVITVFATGGLSMMTAK